jgi:hypothetical protein
VDLAGTCTVCDGTCKTCVTDASTCDSCYGDSAESGN